MKMPSETAKFRRVFHAFILFSTLFRFELPAVVGGIL